MTMQKEYEGHTITVVEMRFKIAGELVNQWEESFQHAKEAIDKAIGNKRIAERVKLNLPVLNGAGLSKTITGVHARNFNALGLGDSGEAYPHVPFLQALLVELSNCYQRSRNIESQVRIYRIETFPHGTRGADFAAERITASHKDMTDRAEKKQAEIDAAKEGKVTA